MNRPALRRRTNAESSVTAAQALDRLRGVVANIWAPSSTSQRQRLWSRMLIWVRSNSLSIDADSAVLFVLATGTSPQAQLTYTNQLAGMFRHFGWDNQSLLSLASALRADGAAIPENQAAPIEKARLVAWARNQPAALRLAAFVAWKTASRWGEVRALSSKNFLHIADDEIIIDWGTLPKGRRGNPFALSRWTVIRGDLTREMASLLRSRGPFEQLTETDTEALAVMWSAVPRMEGYSAHSIKRGAVTQLFLRLAQGAPITEDLIARLAKHKTDGGLPEVTLRYAGSDVWLARALRTGIVTVQL